MPEPSRRWIPGAGHTAGRMGGLGGVHASGLGLSGGEKARLLVLCFLGVFLVGAIAALATGKLDTYLSVFTPRKGPAAPEAPGGVTPPVPEPQDQESPDQEPGTPEPGPEDQEPSGDRPVPGVVPGGLPIPERLENDPGDDYARRAQENYRLYREYLRELVSLTPEELAERSYQGTDVWSKVSSHPERWRGQVFRLRGHLVRRVPKTDQPEDLPEGVHVNWEIQILNYGSGDIYTLDIIGECPAELFKELVCVDAIYFDTIEYIPRSRVVRRSAFFLGRDVRPYSYRSPSGSWLWALLGGVVLAMFLLAAYDARRLGQFERRFLSGRNRRARELARRGASGPRKHGDDTGIDA